MHANNLHNANHGQVRPILLLMSFHHVLHARFILFA